MYEMKTLTIGGVTYEIVDEKSREDISKFNSQNANCLNDTARSLLITILRNAVYNSDQSAMITALEKALATNGGGGTPDAPDVPDEPNPEKTLTSISAVYSGGDVTAGTAVSALTGIVVTAHYSDGTSATVTGYTLSGTIAEGSNTITVSYGGKTTTFTVTGTAESSGGDAANVVDAYTAYEWTKGVYLTGYGTEDTNTAWANKISSQYISLADVERLVVTEEIGKGLAGYTCYFYDTEKAYVEKIGGNIRKDNATYPSPVEIAIPETAAFVRFTGNAYEVDGSNEKILVKYSLYMK